MFTIRSLIRCIVVTVGLCIPVAPAVAQDQLMIDATSVPASIHNVSSGGYWSQAGAEGFFRTVVVASGVEQTAHRLYIQWIAVSTETQDYRLTRSVIIEEFNKDHGVTLELVADFSSFEQLTASITATQLAGDEVQRYVLTAKSNGTYQLMPE